MYNERCDQIFEVEKDIDIIINSVRRAIDPLCHSFGSLANSKEKIDAQIKQTCGTIDFDFQVTDKINKNTDMMCKAEREIVHQTLSAIRASSKDILLNHADIGDYGIEVISEALKYADSVQRLDLSHITQSIGNKLSKKFRTPRR